jgi:hypothetical protein
MKRALATLGIWVALAAPTLAQKIMRPKDIHYLATIFENNLAFFDAHVRSVAKFSGTGRVDSNPVPFSPPDIMVDMGAFGEVECPGSGVQPGLQQGDRVTVSGRVSAAATAAFVHTLNDIAAERHSGPAVPEKDNLYLIANSCQVTKE